MTLKLKLDLDMVKMYLHTKNEVSMSRGSKVIAWTGRNTNRHTDRQMDRQTDMTENITYPHMWVVIINRQYSAVYTDITHHYRKLDSSISFSDRLLQGKVLFLHQFVQGQI